MIALRIASLRLAMVAVAVLAALSFPAHAKNTMTITAEVEETCNINALPMMFGSVSFFLPYADAQTSLLVDCTPGLPFTVAIDDGQNYNGQRRMARIGPGFGNYLSYEIYSDAARNQRWGSAPGQVVSAIAPTDGKVTLTAYGRTRGFIASGPFQDTVTVTISF